MAILFPDASASKGFIANFIVSCSPYILKVRLYNFFVVILIIYVYISCNYFFIVSTWYSRLFFIVDNFSIS